MPRPDVPRLEFWYDLASNYSYLSSVRIEDLAARSGVDVVWRPFLLGPIFKAQGWNTSPFNLYPAKGRNMIRDMCSGSGPTADCLSCCRRRFPR